MVERYLSGVLFSAVGNEIKPIGIARYLITSKGIISVGDVKVVNFDYFPAYRWAIVTYDNNKLLSREPIKLDYESYVDLLIDC